MNKQMIASFVVSQGRIARGTMFFRLISLGLVCIAFGMLAGQFAGSYGNALFSVVFLWFASVIGIQRMHDIGRSGWVLLAMIIPVLGPLWLVTQLLKRGVEGDNRFGKDPQSRHDYLTVDISA